MQLLMTTLEKVDRKEQVIQNTIEIIGKYGFQGLTTARLAESCGVTEGALYRHYRNKDKIIEATIQYIGKRLSNTLNRVNDEPIPAIDKLKMILFMNLEHLQSNTGIPRIIYSPEVHAQTVPRELLFQIIQNYLEMLKKMVQGCVKEGTFKKNTDTEAAARHFLSIIQFSAFRYSLSGYNVKILLEGKKLWGSFLQAYSDK